MVVWSIQVTDVALGGLSHRKGWNLGRQFDQTGGYRIRSSICMFGAECIHLGPSNNANSTSNT